MSILLSQEVFAVFVFAVLVVYLWFLHKFTYWSRRNVQGPKPKFPFGNISDVILRKSQFFQPYYESYFKYKHLSYIGMFCFNQPVLCVIDPEIAKLILINDYEHFNSRGVFFEGSDPLARHIFNIYGDKWKNVRMKLAPAFSPGKLRSFYPLVEKIAQDSVEHLHCLQSNGKALNFTDFYGKYTMEIIANIGFGVKCNNFENADAEFVTRANEYFMPKSTYRYVMRSFAFFAPDLFKTLKLKRYSKAMETFFSSLVTETVAYRETHSYQRNDYIQTLIDLRNEHDKFTMEDLIANTLLYLIAGYETSSTVGQYTIYELAMNPDIQEKARKEVGDVLKKHNGVCTYEAQNEMTYLNMIFDETMRKYPSMRAIFRRCNQEYRLPDGMKIDKGVLVFVPIQAIQMDPEIFHNPETFDPDRFLPENRAKLHRCHWMPFGEGPRKCLGLRQGYIQVKLALVKILQHYRLVPDNLKTVPIQVKASAFSHTPEDGIWVRLEQIHKTDGNNNTLTSCHKDINKDLG